MEDWIRNVEKLLGDEDEDGEPCSILNDEGEVTGELLSRLNSFLSKTAPSQELIDELQVHIIDDVLNETVSRIITTWSASPCTPELQKSLNKHRELMEEKTKFLVTIYRKMLECNKWKHLHGSIYKAINTTLLAVIEVSEQYPHSPTGWFATNKHFQVKRFITKFSYHVWLRIVDQDSDGVNEEDKKLTKIPSDLIVPTMRRLGMLDILDADWNMYGAWAEVCVELNKAGDQFIVKTNADKILEEKSRQWRLARNSIRCRRMMRVYKSLGPNMGPPAQCFRYFSKCSVTYCCNEETPKKPHRLRCQRCWYFHFCSDACESFAEMWDLHTCHLTPPEKAQAIKKETEAYLGWNKTNDGVKHELCKFCSTRADNLPENLLQCSKCKVVAYCGRRCQAWDWADHKENCK